MTWRRSVGKTLGAAFSFCARPGCPAKKSAGDLYGGVVPSPLIKTERGLQGEAGLSCQKKRPVYRFFGFFKFFRGRCGDMPGRIGDEAGKSTEKRGHAWQNFGAGENPILFWKRRGAQLHACMNFWGPGDPPLQAHYGVIMPSLRGQFILIGGKLRGCWRAAQPRRRRQRGRGRMRQQAQFGPDCIACCFHPGAR